MKQVKCKSGIIGWQSRLQKQYEYFELFEAYDENYNNAKRLGYGSAKEAWEANPIIQGSVNPSDLRVVLDEHNKVVFMEDEVKETFAKFLSGKLNKEQLIKKLNGYDGRLKRLFGSAKQKSIWFRTFKGSTGAETIRELESELNLPPSHGNYKYLMECLELGVNELGVGVYFS
jgi:hypothetical protein